MRSDSAPAAGLAMIDTNAPTPVIHASACSLLSGETVSARRGSRFWIGVKNAIMIPRLARVIATMNPRRTGTVGSAECAETRAFVDAHRMPSRNSRNQAYDVFGIRRCVA